MLFVFWEIMNDEVIDTYLQYVSVHKKSYSSTWTSVFANKRTDTA